MNSLIISIITPSYNQGRFIEETIRSVIFQKGDFYIDYVIMDGKSTDESTVIIKKYEDSLRSTCDMLQYRGLEFFVNGGLSCRGISYRWVSEKDRGQVDAINRGLEKSVGQVVAYLNSDDCYLDGALETVAKAQWKHIDLLYGKAWWTNATGGRIAPYPVMKPTLQSLYFQCTLCQPAVFLSRSAWERYGTFNPDFNFSFDYEEWVRFVAGGAVMYPVNRYLACSRMYQENKSLDNKDRVQDENRRLMQTYFSEVKSIFTTIVHFWFYKVFVDYRTKRRVGVLLRYLS